MERERSSTVDFKNMDDEAKIETYQLALQSISRLTEKIDSLEQRLTERTGSPHTEQKEPPARSTRTDDDSSDVHRIQKTTHDLICGLLTPIIQRMGKVESALSDGGSPEQPPVVPADTDGPAQKFGTATLPASSKDKSKDSADTISSTAQLSTAAVSAVPIFSRDVLSWIHQMDYWMKSYRIPDDVAVSLIMSNMPSRDFAWMRHQLTTEKVTTWDDVKSAFRRRYHIHKPVEAAQKMFARIQRQCESCVDYATQKLELMDECGYSGGEQEKCDAILASVSRQVKRRYFDRTFASLDQLLNSFLLYDRANVVPETPKDKTSAPVRRLPETSTASSSHRQQTSKAATLPKRRIV